MQPIARDLPPDSLLAPRLGEAFYAEAYEAPLRRPDLEMHQIYIAILGHLPWWARALIIARNGVVSLFGLHAEPAANVWRPPIKDSYRPGDKIVRFQLYAINDTEVVAGRDDKHLDFRVSVMKIAENGQRKVVLSTLVFAHNAFGRTYLRLVLPFHKFGIRRLLAQAVELGRI